MKPTPDDGYPTLTSEEQRETESIISGRLPPPDVASTTAIGLNRNAHLSFVARGLFQGFPSRQTAQDASQPWFMFWFLQTLSLLGVSFDDSKKQRFVRFGVHRETCLR